jgi:hypothetical protein
MQTAVHMFLEQLTWSASQAGDKNLVSQIPSNFSLMTGCLSYSETQSKKHVPLLMYLLLLLLHTVLMTDMTLEDLKRWHFLKSSIFFFLPFEEQAASLGYCKQLLKEEN